MANNGDFTNATLQTATYKLQEKWNTNGYDREKNTIEAETLKAVKANQTARFVELSDHTATCRDTVKVEWVEVCDLTPGDCTAVTCDFDGPEGGSNMEEYTISDCVTAKFKIVDRDLCNTSLSAEEILADLLMKADKSLVKGMNVAAINAINAKIGENFNKETTNGVAPAAAPGADTNIPSSMWSKPYQYFRKTALLNRYSNPWLLSGSNLWYTVDSAVADFDGFTATYNGFKHHFDMLTLDATVGSAKTFMIDGGTFAFISRYEHDTTPKMYTTDQGGITKYRIESVIVPGVFHDVFYKEYCVDNMKIERRFLLRSQYGILDAPEGCDTDQTGVLSFVCN